MLKIFAFHHESPRLIASSDSWPAWEGLATSQPFFAQNLATAGLGRGRVEQKLTSGWKILVVVVGSVKC